MEDQWLFEQFHDVFEIEPRAGSFDRLRSVLIRNDRQARGSRRFRLGLPRLGIRLAAVLGLVLLAVAFAGAFIAINQFAHRTVLVHPAPFKTKVAVSNANFKCTLPLVVDGTPAFLSFPDGTLTIAATTEHGDLTFVYQARRWLPKSLPVGPGEGAPQASIAISPDGRSYAYVVDSPQAGARVELADVHVRELATGRDRIVYRGLGRDSDPLGGSGGIIGWSSTGIYVTKITEIGANPDVYLVDPNSKASPRRVGPNPPIPPYRYSPAAQQTSTSANFTMVNGGYAWGYANDWETIPYSAQTGGVRGHIDRILRMDLRSGLVETWFSDPAANYVSVVGFDSPGHPFLYYSLRDNPGSYQLFLLTDLNQVVEISAPSVSSGGIFGDAHGVWMGGAGALWLYAPDGQRLLVTTFPKGFFATPPPPQKLIDLGIPDPTSYPNRVQPAGPCR
jgi:hypothetical protein